MKAYKFTVLVIDHSNMGSTEAANCLEDADYINPKVIDVATADIGEWSDNHPLNNTSTVISEAKRLFGDK